MKKGTYYYDGKPVDCYALFGKPCYIIPSKMEEGKYTPTVMQVGQEGEFKNYIIKSKNLRFLLTPKTHTFIYKLPFTDENDNDYDGFIDHSPEVLNLQEAGETNENISFYWEIKEASKGLLNGHETDRNQVSITLMKIIERMHGKNITVKVNN